MNNKIIQLLKNATTFLSGEEISGHFKISRSAIWKHMQELRRQGYAIEGSPHLGYVLKKVPDKLLPQEIQYQLPTKYIGKEIIYSEKTESTMNVAFQKGMGGAREGLVVIAETQTKGRGRVGREWISPKGKGIYLSMILRPRIAPRDIAKITLLSAVAVCETIRQSTALDAKIKWPNDILVKDKKVAGCLTELSAEMDSVRFVVAGVGINVNTPADKLPAHASSLKIESGKEISRVELTKIFFVSYERWYELMKVKGFLSVMDQWRDLTSTLGRKIRITDQNGSVEGKAVDLDESGGLVIVTDEGDIIHRMSGDVVMI